MAWKPNNLRHQCFVPRVLRSVLDKVFCVVESARPNLSAENAHPQWRAFVTLEIYRFYTALQEASRLAREIELATGFSDEELYVAAPE